jgi:IrrE N-terminal-like domain
MTEEVPKPAPFTRRRIAGLAEEALRRSGAVDMLPTPLEEVQRAVGVVERLPMQQLPKAVSAKKPGRLGRILGAFWKEERVVFIDEEQRESRRRWTDGHEAAHAMCAWHGEVLALDDETTLFKELRERIEEEANFGAGQLIFQGGRFHRRALRDQIAMATPIELARTYGASRHATLHHYVEEHPYPVALLVAGRYQRADGSLPIWRSVESAKFTERHGRLADRLPNRKLTLDEDQDSPMAEIVRRSRLQTDPPSKVVRIPDRDGRRRKFVAEAFFNGYCHFILVADLKGTRLGQRVRLAS